MHCERLIVNLLWTETLYHMHDLCRCALYCVVNALGIYNTYLRTTEHKVKAFSDNETQV